MESVELDAKRAKQIVEMKLQEKDVKGAVIFAQRVQNLFPELKTLFQFLGNIVVHISREEEELDWYTVLGVNPFADPKTLKQCYVKLAKSGLDSVEAYKILDKAWGILSNKFEREAYDLRRRSRAMQQNASTVGQATESRAMQQNASTVGQATEYRAKFALQPPNTFWAGKMNTQPESMKPSRVNSKRGYEEGDHTSATRGKAPCIDSRKSRIGLPSVAKSTGNEGGKHNKRKGSVYNIHDSSKNVPQSDMTVASGVDGQNRGQEISVSGSNKSNSRGKKLPDLTTSLLVVRARTEIFNKMDEWIAAGWKKNECSEKNNIENATAKDSGQEGLKTMEVPDSDFHDFDKERTPRSFGENQVWAVYDNDDGMPRLYALVHKVLSKKPFKLQISWLHSESNEELGPLNWIDSGFQKTCGEFWVGKKEHNDVLDSFSHRVLGWTKSAKVYQIFPKKGDVWALYRNWSPDWNKHTTKEEKHKYEMVEVLEDYSEGKGVTIVPLVKAAGFKSVFYQPLDAGAVRTVPKEEIFRFSHQVIYYSLTDQEAPNVPKGSKELDPAAMPLELLQVID